MSLEGGTERHLYNLVKYLDKNRFNCSIIAFNLDEELEKNMRGEGINIYHVPVASYFTINALRRVFDLKRIIRESQIDVVQTFHFKSDTFGVLASKFSGVKSIVSSRRDTGDTKKKRHIFLNKIMNPQIYKFITVCNAVGERIESDEGVKRSKQVTIYNGVDLNRFIVPDRGHILALRKKLGINKEDFVVGKVAYFRPEKSYDIFFKAMLLVKESIKDLKVLTVGRGPTLLQCQKYCEENNLEDRVIYVGRADDIRDYVAVMDVACLVPGSNEGFSNAVLEKMAMGKPLIVTNIGGNAEAVINGENGIIIPPLDHKSLAEAIIYLYNNPSKREEMGRKSRKRVERYFSLERMIKNHEYFYEDIMNRYSGKINHV